MSEMVNIFGNVSILIALMNLCLICNYVSTSFSNIFTVNKNVYNLTIMVISTVNSKFFDDLSWIWLLLKVWQKPGFKPV